MQKPQINQKPDSCSCSPGYRLGLQLALVGIALLPLPTWAGTEPVNAVAPPDAGAAPTPLGVNDGFLGNSVVQPFVFDNVQSAAREVVGANAMAPQALSNQTLANTAISSAEIGSNALVTPISIATTVASSVSTGNPLTVRVANRRLQVTPGEAFTTVAIVTPTNTRTQEFEGAPTQVNQQVGTVVALTAAGATEQATESGSAISAVGVQAPDVVNLILGFQTLASDFTSASLPADQAPAQPVLIASLELTPGLLAQSDSRRVNLEQLNLVIAAYNQVITNCPPELLPKLSENAEFQAIGETLRQLRAAVQR